MDVSVSPQWFCDPLEYLLDGYRASCDDNENDDFIAFLCELINAGCRVNYINRNGENALHLVCSRSDLRLAKILLNYGCNTELRNKIGELPIDKLASEDEKNKYSEWIRLLQCR